MRWLFRFLAWATVLAVPSWLLGDAYHRALAFVTLTLLGIPTDRFVYQRPDIPATHVLGVFAAMCLASTRAPRPRRLWAIAIGLVCMVALELLDGMLAIRWGLEEASGRAVPVWALRMRGYLTTLPAWIEAPVLWLVMLGRYELPRLAGRNSTPPGPVREPRGPGGRAAPRAG
ncbi:MAG TPA: hypothetical protein VJY35_10010 [Candidatus Eisenbacteria bacterium]|nr:hypothetical protein [Candidatus Eisenbacteria bacterium]